LIFVFLSVLFFFFQNIANKEYGVRFSTSPKTLIPFHVFTHIAMLLALLVTGFECKLPPVGYVYAFLYGLNFVLAINMLMYTFKLGSIGKTTLIVNLSMLLPMILGLAFWGEKLNTFKMIGIPCVLVCLVLSVSFKNSENAGASAGKWVAFAFITFLLDGSLSILQKLFLRACPDASLNAFVSTSVLSGLCVSVIASLVFAVKDKRLSIPSSNGILIFLLLALVVGASTAFATVYNMRALAELKEGVKVFPVRQGGLILMITVYGIFRYKEKFDLKTLFMLISGIAGIILLNME